MSNARILRTAELVSAPAQEKASQRQLIRRVDDEVALHGLGAQGLPASGHRVDCSEDGEKILRVAGVAELTAAQGKRFRKQVCSLLKGHTVIEIDLSRTTSMDCTGLGALVAIRNLTLNRSGVIRLMNPNPRVQQLLDLMRAGEIFEIVKTLM